MTFANVKYYYNKKQWSDALVKMAVKKGIITKEEYTEITGKEYK